MWIRRQTFDDLVAERTKREAAEKTVAILEQHRNWLAAQVNRLEGERALLLQRIIGVAMPVPEVVPVAAAKPETTPLANVNGRPMTDLVPGIDVGALMLGAAAFEDVGDEEAERQGLGAAEVAVQLSSR